MFKPIKKKKIIKNENYQSLKISCNNDKTQNCIYIKCRANIVALYELLKSKNKKENKNYQLEIRKLYKKLNSNIQLFIKEAVEKIFESDGAIFLNYWDQSAINNNLRIKSNIDDKLLVDYLNYDMISFFSLIRKTDVYFIKGKKLGIGSYASVFETLEKNKVIRVATLSTSNDDGEIKGIENFKTLSSICPYSVPQLFDYGIEENELFIIMEKGLIELKEIINIAKKTKNKYLIILFLNILIICVEKIKCLHDNKYLHCDIKPENIMIFEGTFFDNDIEIEDSILNLLKENDIILVKYIKIRFIDFGYSSKYDTVNVVVQNNVYRGTPKYMSEEVLSGNYNYRVDLYAIARIYQELFTDLKEINLKTKKRNNNSPKNNKYEFNNLSNNKQNNLKKFTKKIIPDNINTIEVINNVKNRRQSYEKMKDLLEQVKNLFV